jgi:hypothetical protein
MNWAASYDLAARGARLMVFLPYCGVVAVLAQSCIRYTRHRCAQARLALTQKSSTGEGVYG